MCSFSCKLYSCIISLFFININVSVCEPTRIRLVTWNAADNKEMFGGFTDAAIDNVLGLVNTSREQMPGIYALAIEENCWMCNEENWIKFGHRFQERINKRSSPTKYKLIGVQGTRKSGFCEAGCSLKTHGSTLIVVIAKGTFASTHVGIRLNSECSSKYIPNKEKGKLVGNHSLSTDRAFFFWEGGGAGTMLSVRADSYAFHGSWHEDYRDWIRINFNWNT